MLAPKVFQEFQPFRGPRISMYFPSIFRLNGRR